MEPVDASSSSRWINEGMSFSWHTYPLYQKPPEWLRNPFTGKPFPFPQRDWWRIPDFDTDAGDIKVFWEASRFDWALAHAQRARNGEETSLGTLNDWLTDWNEKNPPYKGPNWKCGQEASIRVMHLAMASLILGQAENPLPSLAELIRVHLRRIAPTINYAMAQDNNHGTSEAAALFIGGTWLELQEVPEGKKWARTGRQWLENRVGRLFMPDGSFSQSSLNYHRLALDTLCMVEVWRQRFQAPPFSATYKTRLAAATEWLRAMVDPLTGEAPNLGANDGARLLPLTDTPYGDCRPSVQLASVLFADAVAYQEEDIWDAPLRWLAVPRPQRTLPPRKIQSFDDGGYTVLRTPSEDITLLFRYPRFRFRPSHSDALHVDLWKDGVNLLRDGGSYSYFDLEWLCYFTGVRSHNTAQFDGREQMPRLGRFLFGEWLKTTFNEPLQEDGDGCSIAAGYVDWMGARHHRRIVLHRHCLNVTDEISGFKRHAVLRWRLSPTAWKLDDHTVGDGRHTICIEADAPLARIEMVDGWESRHYLDLRPLPVLEVEVRQSARIKTTCRWS